MKKLKKKLYLLNYFIQHIVSLVQKLDSGSLKKIA